MGLNDVKFIKQDGSLGGVLPNEDHISALVFIYQRESTRVQDPLVINYPIGEVFGLKDAENKGITKTDYPLEHYHISEFFRVNSQARLFVGYMIEDANVGGTYNILEELQNKAEGKIRQFGIVDRKAFNHNVLANIQTKLEELAQEHKPAIAVYGANMSELELSTLPDLRTKGNAPRVSVLISQSGTGRGAELVNLLGISVPAIGNCLGMISKAAVHENIGWIEKFRADGNDELIEVDFCTGEPYNAVPMTLVETLHNKGYIFLRHHIGISGAYYNDSHTATAITSDYCYIERNRTIDKAIRGMRTYLLPKLNSPLELDAKTGKLALPVVKYFENLAGKPLEQMQKDGELSGFKVIIDPEQDILTTSELKIQVQLVLKGVARTITVYVSFAKSVN